MLLSKGVFSRALVAPAASCAASPCGLLSQRAAKVGVKVKATKSEIKIAKAIVRPNEFMNRPTIPVMNATGKKTATRESVVA